jgi:acyl carrier protein
VIKLHGQRVDCAELESALTALREVREAAVVVRNDDAGRPRLLVAYVSLRPGNQGLLGRHLQAMLAQTLPSYMVPGRVVIVEALPQLPSMKIDRMRLAHIDAAQAAEAPDRGQDPLLDDIARVFETVLELSGASADDNVASLGGDSLQAITVMTEIERRFGAPMPDEFVAEDPTIRSIAGWLVSVGRATQPQAAGSH